MFQNIAPKITYMSPSFFCHPLLSSPSVVFLLSDDFHFPYPLLTMPSSPVRPPAPPAALPSPSPLTLKTPPTTYPSPPDPLYSFLFYPILSYPILSYPILSYPILSYPILSYPIPSHPINPIPFPSSYTHQTTPPTPLYHRIQCQHPITPLHLSILPTQRTPKTGISTTSPLLLTNMDMDMRAASDARIKAPMAWFIHLIVF